MKCKFDHPTHTNPPPGAYSSTLKPASKSGPPSRSVRGVVGAFEGALRRFKRAFFAYFQMRVDGRHTVREVAVVEVTTVEAQMRVKPTFLSRILLPGLVWCDV